jgi:hypothetical protein
VSRVACVTVLPAAPLLLPEHAGLIDPVPELRAACHDAVRLLLEPSAPVIVLSAAPPPVDRSGAPPSRGGRLARSLLDAAGHTGALVEVDAPFPAVPPGDDEVAVLALADGSARRGEKAPGHLDARAAGYDSAIGAALLGGDVAALGELDLGLGAELLAEGAPVLRAVAGWVQRVESAEVSFDDDPFGVQYWVAHWRCTTRG